MTRRKRHQTRLLYGDKLGISQRQAFERCPEGKRMVSFKSIFQGDHAGVEIATAAHKRLLQSVVVGLLSGESRIVSGKPFFGGPLCQGLDIDDYFAIVVVPRSVLVPSPAVFLPPD